MEEIWNKMYDMWVRQNVPSVRTRKLMIGKESPRSPWYSLKNNSQDIFVGNPMNTTAFHISYYLKDKNPELLSAYQIFAFLKTYTKVTNWWEVLSYPIKKHDEDLRNWGNANESFKSFKLQHFKQLSYEF